MWIGIRHIASLIAAWQNRDWICSVAQRSDWAGAEKNDALKNMRIILS